VVAVDTVVGLTVVAHVALAAFVASDAARRRRATPLWTLATLAGGVLGAAAYYWTGRDDGPPDRPPRR